VSRVNGDVTLLGVSLPARWTRLDASLQALAHGLERELSPLWHTPFPVPMRKARLTRIGGRCAHDGTPLTFDPWRPVEHACPTCGAVHRGLEHDDWWAMGAQLWSAERVLQAAMLGAMQQRDDLLALSTRGLEALSAAWPTYANRDNALGPTRPFFSTYLESVWLLNLSLAAKVLAQWPPARRAVDRLCDTVVEPSRALIRSFPEGHSNRQAWHVAARVAAGTLLGDARDVHEALFGHMGLRELLEQGLLPDGSWYEGENYHLFAHRGLWYAMEASEAEGTPMPAPLRARFNAGFRTPLLGILPDGTFPARRDSRYATSVHQWRFAEWCELGLVRHEEPVVAAWLQRLYHSTHTPGDTGRARSTADIERDEPPCALTRADLGWRTLLFARASAWAPRMHEPLPSVALEAQGLTVLRSDGGRIYVALEGGHPGGGHGHPDRLALTLQDGARRVLEDPGTGSYVERTLHWYRSTLAHNAPLVNGRSQDRVPTQLLAFDVHNDAAWMQASAPNITPGVTVERTVVLCDEHVVDVVTWHALADIDFTLPMHGHALAVFDGQTFPVPWQAAQASGAGGLEDGFDFLSHIERANWPADQMLRLHRQDVSPACAWVRVHGTGAATPTLWRAMAPGPPRCAPRPVHWVQVRGCEGTITTVWSLRGAVQQVTGGAAHAPYPITVRVGSGATIQHELLRSADSAPAWRVRFGTGHTTREVRLAGHRASTATVPTQPSDSHHAEVPIVLPHRAELGRRHYRGSEQPWEEAGAPAAVVDIARVPGGLTITVDASTGALVVPPADAVNPLDNERADVNADGIQLYLARSAEPRWRAAWLLVPEQESARLRITPLQASTPAGAVDGHWQRTPRGWRAELRVAAELVDALADPAGLLRLDVIVNERPPERERRRGQLLLSGSGGEFVYLRGDRHDPARALLVRVHPHPVSANPSARFA
jgi:hypothetical protein